MLPAEMSETEFKKPTMIEVRASLEKFERSKILEVYFSRLDGRAPAQIPDGYRELYELDLTLIKSFLLNQHPQDSLLLKVFKMMS